MGPPLIAPASAASPTNLSFVNSPNKVFTLIQGKEDPNRNESTIDLSRQEVDIGYVELQDQWNGPYFFS